MSLLCNMKRILFYQFLCLVFRKPFMKLGCNHPIGPLALADLIGLDVVLAIMEVLHDNFCDPKYRPAPLLREMVDAGRLGRKTGRGFFEYS